MRRATTCKKPTLYTRLVFNAPQLLILFRLRNYFGKRLFLLLVAEFNLNNLFLSFIRFRAGYMIQNFLREISFLNL